MDAGAYAPHADGDQTEVAGVQGIPGLRQMGATRCVGPALTGKAAMTEMETLEEKIGRVSREEIAIVPYDPE
ncbi:MAG: hypothetical protein KKA32_05075 [Actinobacteria bacterium]|nr:hypothetical protein [Actinomycetota bacterium]